ncbi:MAG: hypothetical protein IPM18_04160 [Phycisphaerales bacterium]|nr:hypothetical protein [Phycisphaerales bacterium]
MVTWWLVAAGSAGGLALVATGLFRDRGAMGPRCPRCWYDMRGGGLRCPECGHVVWHARELLARRRRWGWVVTGGMLLVLSAALSTWQAGLVDPQAWLPPWQTLLSRTLAGAEVRIDGHRRTGEQRLRIRVGGRDRLLLPGWRLALGGQGYQAPTEVGVGQDVTGTGSPSLIVVDYSGGAHCCWTYYVLDLAPPRIVAVLDTTTAGYFDDLDDDGVYEFITADPTFDYWNASHAESPFPRVVLAFRAGRYRLAPEYMRTAPPSSADFDAWVNEARTSQSFSGSRPAPLFWGRMLDLIYGGHADLAEELFRLGWPPEIPGKHEFRADFDRTLRSSRYWPDLRLMQLSPEPH